MSKKRRINIMAGAVVMGIAIMGAVAVGYHMIAAESEPQYFGSISNAPSETSGCLTDIQAKAIHRQIETTEGLKELIREKFKWAAEKYEKTECQEETWCWWPADEHDPACWSQEAEQAHPDYWQSLTDEMIAAAKADDDGVTRAPNGNMLITRHALRERPPISCWTYTAEHDIWLEYGINSWSDMNR